MNSRSDHISVLANQVLTYINPRPNMVFIDCTLGLGGHSETVLKELNNNVTVYGIEVDERNLSGAKERLKDFKNVHFINDNFENLESHGREILKKEGKIDAILFDLGLSSPHIDEATRGFSFQQDGPLDMRFSTTQNLTAADIVNTYTLEQLLFIFKTYGEEKYSYRIANKIIEHRKRQKFNSTAQLADFIEAVVSENKYFYHSTHPATRIFQALRIATNREIEVLEQGLAAAINLLSPQGRLVVISYHSLEDRIAKNLLRDGKKKGILKVLTKKPILPTEEEIAENRRSRSAHLRAAEKI